MTTGAFSLTKENMGEGGQALPVGDLLIKESSFVAHNFDGKAPMSIYLRWLFVDAAGVDTQAQYYRVGDTVKWGVAPDQNSLVPVNPDDTKLPKTSGCGQALSALEDIGFPLALLDQGLASNFIGVHARFQAEKRLSQQDDTPVEGTRGPGMLSIPKLMHSYGGQVLAAPAVAAVPPVAAPVVAPVVAPAVAAVPPVAAPAVAAVPPVTTPAAVPPVVAPVVAPVAAPVVAPVVAPAPVAAVAPVPTEAASVPPTPPPPSPELIATGLSLLGKFIASKPSVKRADLSTEVFSNAEYATVGAAERNELAALMHTQPFADAIALNGYVLTGDVITIGSAAPAPAPA